MEQTRPPFLMVLATGLATLAAASALVVAVAFGAGPVASLVPAMMLLSPVTAWLVVWRAPDSAVAPALAWTGGAVAVVDTTEMWAASGAAGGASIEPFTAGLWPWNLAGVFALLLVFPDGRLLSRRWRMLPWVGLAAAAAIAVGLRGVSVEEVDERVIGPGRAALVVVGIGGVAVAFGGAVAAQVHRFRRGDDRTQAQVQHLMLAGGLVLTLLATGWVAQAIGVPASVAYAGFVVAILIAVPLAVTVAITRHDLFDVEQLFSDVTAWLLTALVAAGVYAGLVVISTELLSGLTRLGVGVSALVTAVALLPLHRAVIRLVARVVDSDRQVAVAEVERFASDVRSGRREPEDVLDVLRAAQGDPELRVLLSTADGFRDLAGNPVRTPTDGPAVLHVSAGADHIATVHLGRTSARARYRARQLVEAAWLPVEASWLRLGLRQAIAEAAASRDRLARATAEERCRLERDLHDGAQQQVVSLGMRLRSLQIRTEDDMVRAELDSAVLQVEEIVGELRRMARGVRPSRLDDGLSSALETLRASSPVPFDLRVEVPDTVDESRATAAYFVVAESLANTFKHASADRVTVSVRDDSGQMVVEITDNGVGGVAPEDDLTALRDRVRSVGGTLLVESPAGAGTVVRAVI